MAKNGIYTRNAVSRKGKVIKASLEIYQRKTSKIYRQEVEYKGDLTTADVWDLAKRQMKPGEALLSVDIIRTELAMFEIPVEDFYTIASCRLLEEEKKHE